MACLALGASTGARTLDADEAGLSPQERIAQLAAGLKPARLPSGPITTAAAEQTPPPAEPQPMTRARSRRTPPAEPGRFRVSSFHFAGNTVVPTADLQALARPWLDREVTLQELSKLTESIQTEYRSRGYFLARAAIPPQKVHEGRVRVAILEGKFGKVRVEGNSRYSEDFIRRYFDSATSEAVVNQHKVEHALLILNELPDIKVHSVFDRGAKPGTTDVALKVEESDQVHVGIDYNNYGNRLVGRNRAGLGVWASNAITQGDQIFAHATFPFPSSSQPYYQAGYALPIGYAGDRLALSYSTVASTVGEELQILDIRGNARVEALNYSHPMTRSPEESTTLSGGLVIKDVQNFVFVNQLTNDDRLRELTLGFDGTWTRTDSKTVGSAILTQGLGTSLGGEANGDQLSSRPGSDTGDTFTKVDADLTHFAKLTSDDFVLLHFSGQVTSHALTVPELFALGGVDSVRGFQQSAFLGDQAVAASAEYRRTLATDSDYTVQGAAFLDWGTARLIDSLFGEVASRTLAGAGLGLRADVGKTTSLRLDLGFPISGKTIIDDAHVWYGQLVSRF